MTDHKLFIDSWGFICLFSSGEPHHLEVKEYFNKCMSIKYRMLTSNLVISEVITLLYRKLGHEKSKVSIDYLFESIDAGLLECIWSDHTNTKNALELRYRLKDKPGISFVDLSSMIIMKDAEITEVLTADKHFQQVNMGFELKPELAKCL